MKITHDIIPLSKASTPWMLVEPSDAREFCVLWLQGWGSTIEKHTPQITSIAKKLGVAIAVLDYPGHGTHPIALEKTTREQQFHEVVAAYDALISKGYERIVVAGTSFGGYMAALLSAERSPHAVILRAPAIYKDEEFSLPYLERQGYRDKEYEAMKYTITSKSNLTALHAIAHFDGSVYVVEHEIDSVIPRNIPRAYFEVAKRGNYLVVPATDHAVAKMPEPEKHYAYIEHLIVSIIQSLRLGLALETTPTTQG